MNPVRFPLFSWQLVSHKLLRYLSFAPLAMSCVLSWFLLTEGAIYRFLVLAQVVFGVLVLTAWTGIGPIRNSSIARYCFLFCAAQRRVGRGLRPVCVGSKSGHLATADGLTMQNAPVKLLFILDDFSGPNAGTEVQFWRLIKGLDRSRVAPAIVLLRPSEFLARELGDIPLKVLNITRLRSGRAVAQIVSAALWARRSRFRVAHIFFNDSAIVFPPLLKMLGLRVIVSRRDLGFWYTPRNLPLLRMAARFVDKVVANCHAVRRAVIDAEGFPPGRVDVIYNAADALHGQPGRVDRALAAYRTEFRSLSSWPISGH